MKKVLVTLLIVILLLGGTIFGSLYVYHSNAGTPLQGASDPLSILVRDQESLYQVVDQLAADGVLKNAWLSKLYYRLSGLNLDIEPGRHEVALTGSLKDLLDALKQENLDNVRVTLPEGFTIANMAARFDKSGLVTKDEFLNAVEAFTPPDYVPVKGERRYRMEGYLKPDTYTFARGTTADAIVAKLSAEFDRNLKAILDQSGRTNITSADYDAIINKAAMIERETNNADERALVASVIENRLAIDMKLQLDATILYALGVDSKAVTNQDMRLESPFSTYHVKGLPAGPICNPSTDSIRAVLAPATTDYIYYVLNPQTGKHFFTASYDEFLAKKKEFNGGGSTTPVTTPGTQPVETEPQNPYPGPVGLPFEVLPATKPSQTAAPATTTPSVP